MKIIRGQRLLQWLEEDSTYPRLDTNIKRGFPQTKRRQHIADRVQVVKVEYIPYENSQTLQVNALCNSSGHQYQPTLVFRNVNFQPEDQGNNVTFRGGDNQEHHITTIPLAQSNVKVKCNCLDFFYRFAAWNAGDHSLQGETPPLYHSKGVKPPVNPLRVPGVCKHIIKVVKQLRQARIVT